MIWTACCLDFFGFFQAGEMTALDNGSFDESVYLGFDDILVDNPESPSFVGVMIKQSKTDPFHCEVKIFLGCTWTDLCPVSTILWYLTARGAEPGPLFLLKDGRWLARSRFIVLVRRRRSPPLESTKLNIASSHSFCIRAVMTAVTNGIRDTIIKTLGRWERTFSMFTFLHTSSQITLEC